MERGCVADQPRPSEKQESPESFEALRLVASDTGAPRNFSDTLSCFETAPRRIAQRNAHLAVVETHFCQRSIAPAMAVMKKLVSGDGEDLVLLFGNVELLGTQMPAADVRFHIGQATS